MVSKVLMFHGNTELLLSGYWYDLSIDNNYPTKHNTLVLVVIPVRNKLVLVEVKT